MRLAAGSKNKLKQNVSVAVDLIYFCTQVGATEHDRQSVDCDVTFVNTDKGFRPVAGRPSIDIGRSRRERADATEEESLRNRADPEKNL